MKQIFLVLLICLLPGTPIQSHAQTGNKWEENLNVLVTELPRRHVNPFAHTSEVKFLAAAQQLRTELPTLNEQQILMRMAALVASLGDAHTVLTWSNQAPLFPLSLQVFEDGIYCVAAYSDAAGALGARLTGINGHPIDEVIKHVQSIIPHENEAWLNAQLPNFLIRSEVLTGLGIVKDTEAAAWEFKTQTDQTVKVDVAPTKIEPSKLRFARAANQFPRTESASGNYWLQSFNDGTLYFKYNVATEASDLPFSRVNEILLKGLADQSMQRLVIDLRANMGGSSALLVPLITALKTQPINAPGRLFVIIGGRTFSSAVLNAIQLKQETKAVLVGQPAGGTPNHFGEVKQFDLPNFGLKVYYSTKYFETMPGIKTNELTPDVVVVSSIKDYLAGVDPFYKAVLDYKP